MCGSWVCGMLPLAAQKLDCLEISYKQLKIGSCNGKYQIILIIAGATSLFISRHIFACN